MSKPNGKPISPAEVTLQPTYDMTLSEEAPLPKVREKVYPKFTEQNRREILLILKAGMSVEVAAGNCRMSPDTIIRWLSMGESYSDEAAGIEGEFRTFYLDSLEATSKGILGFRSQLQEFAKTDSKVAMWLVERLYPRDFGKPSNRIEVTGEGGGPIKVKPAADLSRLTEDRLDQLIELHKLTTEDIVDAEIIEKG